MHTTQSIPSRNLVRRYAIGVYLAVLLLTSGCDTLDLVGGDAITLTYSTGDLCFRFNGITSGGSRTVVSEDALDLEGFLSREGFTTADVIEARVRSAEIRLVFPSPPQTLTIFDSADLQLRASSGAAVNVASTDAFANERRDNLDVNATRDVSGIVSAPEFEGVLQLVGAASIQDDIEVTINLTIDVDVEGI